MKRLSIVSLISVTLTILFVCAPFVGCQAASHEHAWIEATCTAPRTCSVCGEVEGEIPGHSWVDATCTDPQVCSVCGATRGQALGHDVQEWTVIQTASCKQLGIQSGVCTRCGQEITDEIPLTDHTYGEWKTETAATDVASGTRVTTCLVCGETKSESYSLTAEEKEAYFKQACKSMTFNELSRNPDNYAGEYVKFTGEVIQVLQEKAGSTIRYDLRVDITKTRYGYTDTIYVTYTGPTSEDRILEDDIITIYGVVKGEYTYETIFGSKVTLPLVNAKYITIT